MNEYKDFNLLSEEDQDLVSDLNTRFLSCEDKEQFSEVMQRIRKLFPFGNWVAGLCKLEDGYKFNPRFDWVHSFPEEFAKTYYEQVGKFYDVVVIKNFDKDNYGQLQRQRETHAEFENHIEDSDPTLLQMHQNWRKFITDWGMSFDGYTLGEKTYFQAMDQWYGSILTCSDLPEYNVRIERIMQSLIHAQHLALVKIIKPGMVDLELPE